MSTSEVRDILKCCEENLLLIAQARDTRQQGTPIIVETMMPFDDEDR